MIARLAWIRSPRWGCGLPVLFSAGLFALSSIPGEVRADDPDLQQLFVWLPPSLQNLLHVPVFAALAWLWCWSLAAWTECSAARTALALVLTVGYGMLDELHQASVPGRYGSFVDLSLDVVGGVIGVTLFAYARRGPDARLVGERS